MSDSPATHLLSLKVMRVSRPALASAWQPFYSSSPSFSAHSTQSILSLQGTNPLPGYPKTLRDLTQVSELLTLPSSFGSIQLGETFSSCLSVNNEATTQVDAVALKVEMQTATSKITLAEIGGKGTSLEPQDTLENVVHHEIKELGQHVLACTVSYRFNPQNSRTPPASEETSDPNILTFRKFYKFVVTNPLSVKTKVHAPRSPSALMVPAERDKIFLECHIQNLTPESIWFERMHFEAAEGWNARDTNVISISGEEQSLYTGSTALMQPQDTRQYIYILSPKLSSLEPVIHSPGSVVPLGRLDISWRSSYGEPGRLLTSMLTRRIPLLPQPVLPQPVSALPPYLKRQSTSATTPAGSKSPQLTQSRPGSPVPRSSSPVPYRARASSIVSGFPQIPPSTQLPASTTSIDVHLLSKDVPRDTITLGRGFKLKLTLALSSLSTSEMQRQRLQLSLVIQHIGFPPTSGPTAPSASKPAPPPPDFSSFSPHSLSSPGFSSPSPTYATFNYPLAHQKLLEASQEQSATKESLAIDPVKPSEIMKSLPPPFFEKVDESKRQRMTTVAFSGPSAIVLPPIDLVARPQSHSSESSSSAAADSHAGGSHSASKHQATLDFELDYVALRRGFALVGGLRLLLVGEKLVDDEAEVEKEDEQSANLKTLEMRMLKEWNVIAEVLVS
ncbi:hypothetical protein GGU11DRAFT_368306 [Lentinula aff. detonsa]|uniref:DUF974-domain-containing protein n=1 Tax=Lentinula aff. detonsa TaxID=2804958 RepID=A0AA38NNQ7_9AGAR|nr:hypothetical protein GGU10DRAFT_412739 [Lentinula aff. detonsa]KAJ3793821.1 hypothetical protein GGU11DRAFT_368306 [Lentinula aff. detonsa]